MQEPGTDLTEMCNLIKDYSILDTVQLNMFDVVSGVGCKMINAIYLMRWLTCRCVAYNRQKRNCTSTCLI